MLDTYCLGSCELSVKNSAYPEIPTYYRQKTVFSFNAHIFYLKWYDNYLKGEFYDYHALEPSSRNRNAAKRYGSFG